MTVKDLQARQGNVDIILEIVDKAEPKEFSKFGKSGRVCTAKAKDETGEIKLSLWNEQIDEVNVGDKVHITNGYVNEWQGEKQLTTGKFGKLEIVGKSEGAAENAEEKPKSSKKKQKKESDIEEEGFEEEKEPVDEEFVE